MSAVDEIRAAIEKLTTQRNAAPEGEWTDHGGFIMGAGARWVCGDVEMVATNALIVTLHRTIDAQLAILRECLDQAERVEAFPEYWYMPVSDQIRALVRAINGVAR